MANPILESASGRVFSIGGWLGRRINKTLRNWLLALPNTNPALLQMFRDRDLDVYPNHSPASEYLLPWSGEFAGKYLIAGAQFLRLTADPQLKDLLTAFVAELIACQDHNGYLGAFERTARMVGKSQSLVWSNVSPAKSDPTNWNGWFSLGDNVFPEARQSAR